MTNPTTADIRSAALAYFTDEAHFFQGKPREGFPLWISAYVATRVGVELVDHGSAPVAFHKRVCKVLRAMRDDGILVSSGGAQTTTYRVAPTPEELAQAAADTAAYQVEVDRARAACGSLRALGFQVDSNRTAITIDAETAEYFLSLLEPEVIR